MRTRIVSWLALALVCTVTAADAKTVKTTVVDCSKGDSINEALKSDADELVVEVRGFCSEAVVLERDGVTLRGSDPTTDGIVSPGPLAGFTAPEVPLTVRDGEGFVIENLALRGGWNGIRVRGSLYDRTGARVTTGRLVNCRVVDNVQSGVVVYDAYVQLEGVVIAGTGGSPGAGIGLTVQRGWVAGSENTFADNASWGIWAQVGSLVSLESTDVTAGTGGLGIVVQDHSKVRLSAGSTLTTGATGRAVEAGAYSYVFLSGTGAEQMPFSGQLLAYDKGMIWLLRATQTGPPSASNAFDYDAQLEAFRSTLEGSLVVGHFAKALLELSSAVHGEVLCNSAGDAWLDGSVTVSDGVHGCDHAP